MLSLADGKIVDILVGKLDRRDAGPFQAPELAFYYMHARLWLLTALARIALDDPKAIAKYKDVLLDVVRDKYGPHVLMRHFAARALITCMDAKEIELPGETETLVRNIDCSPKPRLHRKLKNGNDFYGAGRQPHPKPSQTSVSTTISINTMFSTSATYSAGQAGRLADRLSEIVSDIDPKVKSMYDLAAVKSATDIA